MIKFFISGSRHTIHTVLFLLILFPITLFATENIEGTWTDHAAANLVSAKSAFPGKGHIHRIVDTPRYTFFSIRAAFLDRDWNNDPDPFFRGLTEINQLFVRDKTERWGESCIRPASSIFQLSGTKVLLIEYFADSGTLAIVYDNFIMDLFFDNGGRIVSNVLAEINLPGENKIPTSIRFDKFNNCLYLCSNSTVFTLSASDGEVLAIRNFDKEVTFANRVGNKMIIAAGSRSSIAKHQELYFTFSTQLYMFDAEGATPATLTGHELKSGNTTLTNIQDIIPYSDNTALILSGNGSTANLDLINIDNNNQSGRICSYSLANSHHANDYNHLFNHEAILSDTPGATLLHCKDRIVSIKKDISTDDSTNAADFKNIALSEILKPDDIQDEQSFFVMTTGTSDDSSPVELTFYKPRTGFYQRFLSDNKWTAPTPYTLPNGPGHILQHSLVFHPKYGMLGRGPGSRHGFGYSEGRRLGYESDDLTGYKDGVWTQYNYTFTSPDLYGSWSVNGVYTEPTSTHEATYIVPDPINPDWIWSGINCRDYNAGVARINLSDPDDFFMMGITDNKSWASRFPGFKPTFPPIPGAMFNGWCAFTNPSFDTEGRMWIARDTNWDMDQAWEYTTKSYIAAYWFTADERRAMTKDSSVPELHEFRIPNVESEHPSTLIALRSPGNENVLLFTPDRYVSQPGRRPCLYDHNGTLEDYSDDRQVIIDNEFVDTTGTHIFISEIHSVFEDVTRREVWLNTKEGPYIIDPQTALAGTRVCSRLAAVNGKGETISFENIHIKDIDVDGVGRKWLATMNGLFCLSSDNTKILGHWTPANSPIPDSHVYSVGCDHSTGSVFVGTMSGTAEFRPQGVGIDFSDYNHNNLTVWPDQVSATYHGYVTITGAMNTYEYEVINPETNAPVATLGKPIEGRLQWDLCDSSGKRVKSGRYGVRPTGTEKAPGLLIIL